jgi:hypothetical protein
VKRRRKPPPKFEASAASSLDEWLRGGPLLRLPGARGPFPSVWQKQKAQPAKLKGGRKAEAGKATGFADGVASVSGTGKAAVHANADGVASVEGRGKVKAKAKGRPKFDLVLNILVDIKPPPSLAPAEIAKKVLAKVPPELRRRWEKVGPDGQPKPPLSRRLIYRAYQNYLAAHSSK